MPRSYARLAPLALSAALTAGCTSITTPEVTLWEGTLAPVPPSPVAGQIAAVSQFGGIQVSVEIRLATPDEIYGWRLVEGTCAAPGRVIGGVALYPPLQVADGRTAEGQTTVPGSLSAGGSYAAVVVLALPGGGEEPVACGALVERE